MSEKKTEDQTQRTEDRGQRSVEETLMFRVGVMCDRSQKLVAQAWDGVAPLDRDRAWELVSALRVASAAAQELEVRIRQKPRSSE